MFFNYQEKYQCKIMINLTALSFKLCSFSNNTKAYINQNRYKQELSSCRRYNKGIIMKKITFPSTHVYIIDVEALEDENNLLFHSLNC